ncbi:hypothetical protein [Lysinibacillus sp. G4S2]|uniref:hypothetical protein n=1 Tax=Lysinibacillus sp. G4S2 TaxID=3055859 RepID=UPI0025A1FC4C|nr:hypothetical protein [Lysinibacillus sp. G4S2]MDM5250633.1 hypothetical protein [Lysinibacillus sp. G4S2]
MGISVTDETLERATRVKRLIGRPQEALLCAKESAANLLSVRKRSVSNKAPSRNGNQPHVLVMNLKNEEGAFI